MVQKKLTYTQAMEKLESIVNNIENGHSDIDKLCDQLKEAQSLIQFCKDKLYKTEQEVQKILQKDDEQPRQ